MRSLLANKTAVQSGSLENECPLQQALLLLLAFAIGGVVTTYLSANTLAAGKIEGSELPINLSYFVMALVASIIILLIKDGRQGLEQVLRLPWYAFVTGVVASVCLFYTTQLIGNLGPDKFFVCSVAGQLTISVALTHFGLLGTDTDPVNWQKIIGMVLAIGGAVLVSFELGSKAAG